MIFAHGPWWSEWHHLVDIWPALVAGGAGVIGWIRVRFMFKEKDDDEQS